MLGMGLQLNKNSFLTRPILNQVTGAVASYSLRKLRSGVTNAIRVRDDTTTETDIPFCGQNLCTSTLTSWLGRNLVAGIPLGVDTNANGVSDGWANATGGAITGTNSISLGFQKMEITSSTLLGNYLEVYKQIISVAGNSITMSATYKVAGNARARLSVLWYNGASFLTTSASAYVTSTTEETLSFTSIVPATATHGMFGVRVYPVNNGDTGSAYFKDASVTISNQSAYISKWYDQSGNGNDAVQATAGNQPRIVNAGVVNRDFDATKANALYPTFASASGVNLVANGDFSNGTTGWSGLASSISASNNTLVVTGSGASASARGTQTTNMASVVGKRVFIRAKVRVTNSSCVSIILDVDGATAGANQIYQVSNPVQNQWYTVSNIVTQPSDVTGNIMIKIDQQYADAATANNKVMEVQEVVCVDVTEMGVPTCYFDGSNDVLSIANSASVDILGAPLMLNAVVNTQLTTGAEYILSKNVSSGVDAQYGIGWTLTNNNIYLVLENGTKQSTANGSAVANKTHVYSGTFESGVQKGYINGTNSGSDGNYNSTLTSRANMQIGARSTNAGGTSWELFFKGNITEITILTSTSGRSKLERNQGKYYGITVA